MIIPYKQADSSNIQKSAYAHANINSIALIDPSFGDKIASPKRTRQSVQKAGTI